MRDRSPSSQVATAESMLDGARRGRAGRPDLDARTGIDGFGATRLPPRLRAWAARFGGYLAMLAVAPAASAPRPGGTEHFTVAYGLSFLNLGVGKADLTADLGPGRYAIVLDGGLSGLAGWFFQGAGSARSSGRLASTGTVPSAFRIDSTYGTMPVRVNVAFDAGTVRKVEVEPEPSPRPDRVPVTAADTSGVTDPVGMLAVPVGPGPLTASLCERRIPVFDGATRVDIVLSRGAVVQVATGPYVGPALDCRIRWVPVAGHRAKGSSVRRMAENDDMRVRLAPVPGGTLLLPLSIAVGTGWGTARIEATTWGGAPNSARGGAPGDKGR